jgi:hypothetical protein
MSVRHLPLLAFFVALLLGVYLTNIDTANAGGGTATPQCHKCDCKQVNAFGSKTAGADITGMRIYDEDTGSSTEVDYAWEIGTGSVCDSGTPQDKSPIVKVYQYQYFQVSPACDAANYSGDLIEYTHSDTGSRNSNLTFNRKTCQ